MKINVKRAREILNGVACSFGNSLEDKMPGTGVPISEMVATNVGLAEEMTRMEESRTFLIRSVDRLPPRDAQIMIRIFGLDGKEPETLVDIGRRLGLSKERIRKIKEDSLTKLRRYVPVNPFDE